MILFATGFLFLSAMMMRRFDEMSKTKLFVVALCSFSIAVAILITSTLRVVEQRDGYYRVAAVHESIADLPRADIEHIQGTLQIDPGNSFNANYEISFLIPAEGNEVNFALNPGLNIDSLRIDDEQVSYDFSNGLLQLFIARTKANSSHKLSIVASGIPDTSFGYFDSMIDKYSVSALEGRYLETLGTQNAIYDKNYIALTPAIKWYPTAGPAYSEADFTHSTRDYFTVDLEIVVPHEWTVAGPGSRESTTDVDRTRFRFAPSATLPEVGLLGARFIRRVMNIENIEFELLFSPKHTRNLDLFADAKPFLRDRVVEMWRRASRARISYPYGSISIVEVPSTLRIYGGGWRMNSIHSAPSILMVRESGFPTARFEERLIATKEEREQSEHAEILTQLLEIYFENDLSGGNPFITVSRNFMNYQSYPEGNGGTTLGYVVDSVVSRIISSQIGFYSVYHARNRRQLESIARVAKANKSLGGSLGRIAHVQRKYSINRAQVWHQLSDSALDKAYFENNPRMAHDALILKGEILADMLLDSMDSHEIAKLLGTLRNRYYGRGYTVENFEQVASKLQLNLPSDFRNWIQTSDLPAFRIYEGNNVRIMDDSTGMPNFQADFHIANDGATAGMVRVSNRISEQGSSTSEPDDLSPIHIAANSCVRVALHTEYPISGVVIHPYLSLNRDDMYFAIPELESLEPQDIEKLKFVSTVDCRDWPKASIIVDDLDAGFWVDPIEVPERRFFQVRRWVLLNYRNPFYPIDYDQGLPTLRSLGRVDEMRWFRTTIPSAWGRYRHTNAHLMKGSSMGFAHFSATLPSAGRWKLDYHFPFAPSYIGISSTAPSGTGSEVELSFPIWINSGAESTSVSFNVRQAIRGWNPNGEYELEDEEVVVSVKSSDAQAAFVDAIRWTPVSSSE